VIPSSSGDKSNNITGYWSREQTVQGRNQKQQLTSKDRRKLASKAATDSFTDVF